MIKSGFLKMGFKYRALVRSGPFYLVTDILCMKKLDSDFFEKWIENDFANRVNPLRLCPTLF